MDCYKTWSGLLFTKSRSGVNCHMKRLGFLQSIHFKFTLIYLLLILIAMQIIGVYFIGKLELRLVENFKVRSEEHTSELQSRENLVCRLLLEKKKNEMEAYSAFVE